MSSLSRSSAASAVPSRRAVFVLCGDAWVRRPSPSALARRGSPPCFRSEVEYSRDRPFYGDDCIEEFQHPVVTNSAEPLWGFWSLMSKAERREHCQQWLAFHLARCDAIEHDEPQPDYPQ